MFELKYLQTVAKYAFSFSLDDIPKDVNLKAKLIILDSLGVIVAGNNNARESEPSKASNTFASFQSPISAEKGYVIGTDKVTDYKTAALLNGIALVAEELDEGNQFAKGHPACHFFSGLLALTSQNNRSGKEFLESFIVNYEIGARMGAAVKQKESIHPHGNWGIFANGFSVGKLLGWKNTEEYIRAAMLSTSLSMPTLWQSVSEGHQVRNVIVGLNNLHTVLLPGLVTAGFSATNLTPKILFEEVLADGFVSAFLDKDLGNFYYLEKTYFKFYPYCRFCHSSIDAALSLVGNTSLDDIKRIDIKTYKSAAKLKAQEVQYDFEGKFSIPFSVASELSIKQNPLIDETSKKLQIKDLMRKVYVVEDEDLTALLPTERYTAMNIEFWDQESRSIVLKRATGDPDEENLERKVLEKFKRNVLPLLGIERTQQIIDSIYSLEKINDFNAFIKLFHRTTSG
ncbi:hypothetical protein CSV74_00755 [Sporosarcina sp. P19]|uniref:MmgE/PrpD family protein n=1 Tax=Sporosarcina sp. P19 TaxID=2048258 RepID=UPI000C173770|nr:MmgE/PrpD family protein [Sporosarcina sp. P19]PIC78087.1 hypothetical protein CSV74_00755 [Sporosarcina sp. P19]